MATNIQTVTIGNVTQDNNTITNVEATKDGFNIIGSATYKGSDPDKNKDTFTVSVKWTDNDNHTFTQDLKATITSVDKKNDTFTWSIAEPNTFETSFTKAGLHFGSGKVEVTFKDSTKTDSEDYDYACFLHGTRVLTRHGYCPVEELAVGDEVRTMNNGWQPLRWIGHQPVVITPFGLAKSAPVRITAGAFGPALPERDVCVSPDHAIFFRNQLIPAKFLVNGVTVFRDTSIENIEYFHLLLDQHAVIFSEGLATESYVPCENIDWFGNTAECPETLLNAIRAGTAECLNECYPRKTTGPAVEAARALLARFAPAEAKNRAVG